MPKYLIGIDFGTTNSTLAYAEISDEKSKIEQFGIAQLIEAGTLGDSHVLPSFIYYPLKEEKSSHMVSLTWDKGRGYCIGKYAQKRGGELPSQLISSAKSWLCHSGIDRRQPLLPFEIDVNELKISPLQACTDILQHIRESWDQAKPESLMEEQQVFITVPASFDPSARQLILEAAQQAKFPEVILLEEPQAAFYAWLHHSGDSWREGVKVGDHLLVVDIGGGTTDFSLITLGEEEGNLQLNRTAVGAHLLLGGDNIDLTLAYFVKSKFEAKGHFIDDWQMQSIVQACRSAKEQLLSSESPKSCDITIMGRGSKLIGGSLKVELQRDEALKLILEGFFPLVGPAEQSKHEQRSGIQQIGLPYAQDPRITCQLAKFLSRTGEGGAGTDQFIVPKAVLFNGGTTKASALRDRLLIQLNAWAKHFGKPEVQELPNADYDYAVSRGAVSYGIARSGKTIRIKSGTSRSYYVGVEDAAPAVPGMPTPLRAVCVAPFGMEEGSEQCLEGQNFALTLGEQASFRFFSRATEKFEDGSTPIIGTVVKNWRQQLSELHSIDTLLEKGSEDGKTVQIQLKSKVTELGVLELWCVAHDGRKWKLEFDLRA